MSSWVFSYLTLTNFLGGIFITLDSCRCGRSQRLWRGWKFAGPESGYAAGRIFLLVRNATNTSHCSIIVSIHYQPLSPCQKLTSNLKTLLPSTTWLQAPAGRWSSNKEVPTTSTTGLLQGGHQNNQTIHISCHFLLYEIFNNKSDLQKWTVCI